MDQNKNFQEIQNINMNHCDYNTWFLYQQPYIHVSQYNIQSNDFLYSYHNNIRMNGSLNKYFTQNPSNDFETHTVNDNRSFQKYIHRNELTNDYNENSTHKPYHNAKPFLKENEKFISDRNSSKNNVHNQIVSELDLQKYKILSRNIQNDSCVPDSMNVNMNSVDIEVEFPPISNNSSKVIEKITPKHEILLDFKMALQKSKEIKEDTEIIEDDKIKKKRKRKRRKKVQVEESKTTQCANTEFKPFSYINEEFPNLDEVKKELTLISNKCDSKNKNKIQNQSDAFTKDNDKKKLRRRQLLLILPNGMEGQVRIVEAKSIKKSKIKRKTGQDRMKRSIGLLNPLDLSAPTVKRGKERLIPKLKKPSKLKKTILLCRSQKKELREALQNISLTTDTGDYTECKKDTVVEIRPKTVDISTNKIHSKNFREYCNHMISNNINSMITVILKTLINFQDKLYNRDPIKAKIKRRLCFGLREVTKFLNMKKLRLIIIAPDLEKVDVDGGLDDIVINIIRIARESSIPCVFGLNRGSLAYLCFKKYRVGAIGVFNFDGAESQVKELLKAVEEARQQYNQLKQIMETISNDVAVLTEASGHNFQATLDEKDDIYQHNNGIYVGHSRTPSNALSEPISEIIDVNRSIFNSIFEDQNFRNHESDDVCTQLNEDIEDGLVESFVDNVLNCVSKLNLKD